MAPTRSVPPPGDVFNFARHLFELNAGRAGRIAYIDDAGQLSYGELATHRALALRRCVHASGLRREERVLLRCTTAATFQSPFSARCTPASSRSRSTRCLPPTTTPTCSRTPARRPVVSSALLPVMQAAMAAAGNEVRSSWSRAAGDLPAGASAFDD